MRTAITVSGGIKGIMKLLKTAVKESMFDIDEVIAGGGTEGLSTISKWASSMSLDIIKVDPTGEKPVLSADEFANTEIANKAEALIAIWDGTSLDTTDLIRRCRQRALEVYIKTV